MMGSPESEEGRNDDEGPQHQVKIDPFWMGKYEITWDAFEVWMYDLDIQRRQQEKVDPNERDAAADEYQLSQPTEPYMDMTFGMGRRDHPAICMTQLAGKVFCKWLSAKTGRYYRLPTEAEWEYACRAGTTTAYHFGDDMDELDDYGWYFDNSDESYHKIGEKKPNPWGLYDMHGNVAEWVLDQYTTDFYGQWAGQVADNPLCNPKTLFPRVVRGGSWDDDPEMLRSAARAGSTEDWKMQDPQIPKSMWYHTDSLHVGFRIIRPLREPSEEEQQEKWDNALPVQDRKAGR
jgi:formylglycine-generating enzyme required for sulfatase activity